MAPQILQNLADRIQSGTDWVLRTFLAVILRCLGVLLEAVVRPGNKGATHLDEHGEPHKRKGQIIQERMSGASGHQKMKKQA